MLKPILIPALALALTLSPASAVAAPDAAAWQIGPIIRGKNYSQGMPLQPRNAADGWRFDFPHPDAAAGHVHYVTRHVGDLRGKSRIVVRYRVDAAPGTRFVPQEFPERTATVSLVMQRAGDRWTAKGAYEHYRWYAPPETVQELAPGVHEIAISLNDPRWGSVYGKKAADNRDAFADALAHIDNAGLVFGSKGGRGHGVFATGSARFTLLDFRIE